MKGFGIYVKNDLLEPKHIEAMGDGSIFLYLWLLDKMTSISEEGVGKVLGGKPVKQSDIEKEMGIKRTTYNRYVKRLRDFGYISTTRTPFGLTFHVNKATKIFGNDVSKMKQRKTSDVPKMGQRYVKNGLTDVPKMGLTKKTIQLDNTKTIQTMSKDIEPRAYGDKNINELYLYWEDVCGYPLPPSKENRYACSNLLKKHSVADIKRIIDGVAMAQGDRYAPSISDMRQLQSKLTDLIVWGKKQNNKSRGVLKI